MFGNRAVAGETSAGNRFISYASAKGLRFLGGLGRRPPLQSSGPASRSVFFFVGEEGLKKEYVRTIFISYT